jgi:hypothetical protein
MSNSSVLETEAAPPSSHHPAGMNGREPPRQDSSHLGVGRVSSGFIAAFIAGISFGTLALERTASERELRT